MSSDPLTPEERAAAREEAAGKVLEAATMLEKMLKGELRPEDLPTARDPAFQLYDASQARLQAEVAILEEILELVLPELRVFAKPIREHYADQEPGEDSSQLEALFGSLPARHRQAEWLDVPGVILSGGTEPLGALTDAQEGETGASTGQDFWLLVDGRVVEVNVIGTWRVLDRCLRQTGHTLVATRVATVGDVVRVAGGLTDLFMSLRNTLHIDLKALEGKHVADLSERQARFDAIVTEYMKLVIAHTEGLRRVGDSPA